MSSNLINMKVDWNKALRDVDRLEQQVIAANQKALENIAEEIIDEAKTIVPVKTGKLKNSLQVLKSSDGIVTIGSSVNYSKFVEDGTRYMQARPYLWPSIRDMMAKYPETFTTLLYKQG